MERCGGQLDTDVVRPVTQPGELADAATCVPRCPRCDYILIGLPGNRCPECGEPFDWEEVLAVARRPRLSLEQSRGWLPQAQRSAAKRCNTASASAHCSNRRSVARNSGVGTEQLRSMRRTGAKHGLRSHRGRRDDQWRPQSRSEGRRLDRGMGGATGTASATCQLRTRTSWPSRQEERTTLPTASD